uniref:Uncharacterized protein n=1 Tax=Strigamia maritima TaxID=126957 RepID=T1IKF9_STRMM
MNIKRLNPIVVIIGKECEESSFSVFLLHVGTAILRQNKFWKTAKRNKIARFYRKKFLKTYVKNLKKLNGNSKYLNELQLNKGLQEQHPLSCIKQLMLLFIALNLWIISLVCGQRDNSDGQGQVNDGCYDGNFQCDNGICIPTKLHCDGTDDCASGPCVGNYFQCKNGNCIRTNLVCDLENDCGDNSDEGDAANCPANGSVVNRTCSTAQFQCNDHQCVPVRFKCDNKLDCVDNSDEDSLLCTGLVRRSGQMNFTGTFSTIVAFLLTSLFVCRLI